MSLKAQDSIQSNPKFTPYYFLIIQIKNPIKKFPYEIYSSIYQGGKQIFIISHRDYRILHSVDSIKFFVRLYREGEVKIEFS